MHLNRAPLTAEVGRHSRDGALERATQRAGRRSEDARRRQKAAMGSADMEMDNPMNGDRAGSCSERWNRRGNRPMNFNNYANKKSAAESMLDVALLMANASQLKAVVDQGSSFSYYLPLIILIGISLVFQVVVGILLIFIVKYDLNDPRKQPTLDILNNITTGLVFVIVIVNIFITAFGVQRPNHPGD
ncbi:ninjurin-1 [Hypanus sabinus]|uniref:ninjurin-1 n=1 Tax=Hypanus sabinus TaxID=79690 RepID=UPI0028C4E047|nr:ninjurin-1 [Hypanus sabinus]